MIEQLFESILLLVALIGLAAGLRWRGVLRDEHGAIFARLVTDVTLPALIFGALARHRFGLDQLNLRCWSP
jgi:malate permease and related proteins